LSSFWCGETGFVDEIGIKVNGMFRFNSNKGRELADVNRR
jgi:hypothetical protein